MALKPSLSARVLAGPGAERRRSRSRLLTVACLLTLAMWLRYQHSVQLAYSSSGSSGSSSTASTAAAAAAVDDGGGAVGGSADVDSGSTGGTSADSSGGLMQPIDKGKSLQFDVCNGFTNQRIALMSGLVLAAETNRSVVLPDWLLNGYLADSKTFVSAGSNNSVPFEAWFRPQAFAQALAAHGVRVAAGKAAQPWDVLIKRFDSQSQTNALISFLRKKRARQHLNIHPCPAFRMPGALMARHKNLLQAAAAALQPAQRFAGLIEARRAEIATKTGSQGFNLLHVRVEKDWLKLCEWYQNPAEGRDNCMNNTDTVGQQLLRHGFDTEVPLVVTTSFPDAVPDLLQQVLASISGSGYRAVLGSELAAGSGLSREESALVDYYLALQAGRFIGNSVSTFTAFIILERSWLGRFSRHYNGGNVPLELFLPFYDASNS